MKKIKNIYSSDLLKWLIGTVLVLGLVTGNAFELKPYNYEPVKTELRETRKVNSGKPFDFKKAFNNAQCSVVSSQNRVENFISILFHQKNNQETRLKSSRKKLLTINTQEDFLIYFSSKNSEEFELNNSRG